MQISKSEILIRLWLSNQTLLVKQLQFADQAMFDRFATSQNIARQAGIAWECF